MWKIFSIFNNCNKDFITIIKCLYDDDINTPGIFLFFYIHVSSYLSFEHALYYRGLILEKVIVFTNETFNKKRWKKFINSFGIFTCRDILKSAFPFGIKTYKERGYAYIIANPEKALFYRLYIFPSLLVRKI